MFWSVPRGDTGREQMESWGPTLDLRSCVVSLEETQVDNRWRVGDQRSCVVSLQEKQVQNRWRVEDQRSCGVSLEETQVQNK